MNLILDKYAKTRLIKTSENQFFPGLNHINDILEPVDQEEVKGNIKNSIYK